MTKTIYLREKTIHSRKKKKLFTHVFRKYQLLSDFSLRYYFPFPPVRRQIRPKTPEGFLHVHAADSGQCTAKELFLRGSEEKFLIGK